MLKTYKYILKLHHVENQEYSIVYLLSPIYTSLDNLKSRIKSTIIFKNLLECILNLWLINIIVIKLKTIYMLIIKLKNIYIFNHIKTCLWLLVFLCDKEQKLSTFHC
jgi:hypothetical protein